MASQILMPQVGISVESCIITEWKKQKGDNVKPGDVLFTYETDKSSLECESTEEGELLEVFYSNGDEVPVLLPVCIIGKAGEDISGLMPENSRPMPPAMEANGEDEKAESTQTPQPKAEVTAKSEDRLKISPRAKNLAEKHYVDVTLAQPTGPYGRVIERDVREMIDGGVGIMTPAAYQAGAGVSSGAGLGGRVTTDDVKGTDMVAPDYNGGATGIKMFADDRAEFEDVAFSGIRKAISKSMTASLRDIPQLTHNFSFDATEILAYRKKLKKTAEKLNLPNITLNDIVIYGVSRHILNYPELNAHMLDSVTIRYFKDVHMGLAVDTPRGLMVPVIKYANRKSLAEISAEVKQLAQEAVSGTISPDNLSGATFTISNLGTVGVESFSPVINPPQTGILGVCNINQRVREEDGEISVYPAMGLSLTYDHRAIDGAPASKFVHELCGMLENFTAMLAL